MKDENAIVEEEVVTEDDEVIDGVSEDQTDDYQFEEPDDDDGQEVKVPVIDNIDDEEQEAPKPQARQEKTQAKPEPVKPAQPKDTAKTGKISAELIEKARKLGVSDEDIAMFSNPDHLQRMIHLIEPNVSAEKPPVKAETASRPQQEQYSDEPFELDLQSGEYDPAMSKVLQATAHQINGIKSALNNVMSVIQRQNADSFEKDFETMIAGLGDDFADTLGKGSLEQIGTESEFYKNRCRIIDEMNAVVAGYSQTGKKMPSQKELFQRAVNGLFGNAIKKNVVQEITKKVQQRSSQIISRPTGRAGKEGQSPDQRATNAVKEKLREFGAYEETEAEEDF